MNVLRHVDALATSKAVQASAEAISAVADLTDLHVCYNTVLHHDNERTNL